MASSHSTENKTKAEYLQFRNRYVPKTVKTIFVLESPPASGKYFYDPQGSVTEPLFRAMMKDVLGKTSASKDDGLKDFAANGFFLIDATYTPINRLSSKDRDTAILRAFGFLKEDLQRYVQDGTGIILVKANICRLLETKLTKAGFTVLNRGTIIPFPSTGQQGKFRDAIRQVLGFSGSTSPQS